MTENPKGNAEAVDPEKEITANDTYKNWQSIETGEPCRTLQEARLYTDAWIIGELPNLGPYSFLNTIAHGGHHHPRALRPAIVLRVAFHIPGGMPAVPKSDDFEHYHGGDYIDEMAALASLFLGIRLKAGPVDREFDPSGDPYGQPIQYGWKAVPELPPSLGHPQIPGLAGQRNLARLKDLEGFTTRDVRKANTLVKAARMYQQAVWVADSDPALAWLLLVSAVETAAVLWAGNEGSARDRLQAWLPQLFGLLETRAVDVIDEVADILQEYTRSTKKFIDFLLEFAPDPPVQRPTGFLRFSFDRKGLKSAAGIIYGHRSKSLHSGTAFPLPMCSPPQLFSFEGKQDPAHAEVPPGLATYSLGATWQREQTPMLLHTFEYIARGALLAWWKSLDAST